MTNAKPERLLSLDAFRGATILAMILVNNPGSWGHMYAPVQHADWHGWTPTDLIFPFFLFIVGVAMAFSLKKYMADGAVTRAVVMRIVRRSLMLVFLGLLLGACGRFIGLLLGQAETLDLTGLRYPGVLQRIGLVYLIASLIVLGLKVRGQAVVAGVILVGYALLLHYAPAPGEPEQNLSQEGNVVRQVDLAIIGAEHMWTKATSHPTDPEGLLSTLPSVVTTLIGYWVGLALQRMPRTTPAAVRLATVGLAVYGIGEGIALLGMPINKALWTSSFVLVTAGLATTTLAAFLWVFDILGKRTWAVPLQLVGVNAIFVFMASGIFARFLGMKQIAVGEGQTVSLKQWIYDTAFTSWIAEPKLASLAFSLATIAFWWAILTAMWRKGWTIRV
ncbi:MAG: DUF5009 domain-containing protein [Planctomycetota bacterium]